MATDSTTTGSIVVGMTDGLSHGVYPSGTYAYLKPTMHYCIYDPNAVLTYVNGSDIAWASSTGSYFIATGTAGGSTWKALKST